MSEPKRFGDGGGGELARLLVDSAADEAPSPAVRRRVEKAIGLGVGISASAVTTSALGASKAAEVGVAAGLTKWIAVVAITGIAAAGSAGYLCAKAPAATEAPPAPAAPARVTPAVPVPVPVPSSTSAAIPAASEAPATSALAPAPLARVEAPPAPAGRPERGLSDELRLLDEAHAALGSGDTASCLSLLDRHDRDFPTPALAAEALALRVEAQARRGDRAAAARLGSQFLAAYGERPEAQRVRSVLDAAERDTNP